MERLKPDYKRIYTDIILMKYPEKSKICDSLLQKKVLSVFDILKLNQLVFGVEDLEASQFNQKFRAYDKSEVLDILKYQEKNKLNDTQLAIQFKLSRNSVARWKKIFTSD